MEIDLPGVHRAPNIQCHPDLYELENRAADPDGRLEQAMGAIEPWDGRVILDLGAGTGYHLPRFHRKAAHVVAVEPDDALRLRMMRRVAEMELARTSIQTGSAERLFLPDHVVDIVHARFAYFFGPGREPGLAELARVLRPGGTAFVIDNDLRTGTFAGWLRRAPRPARRDPGQVEGFWQAHRYTLVRVASEWRFATRAHLEAVVGNKFPTEIAADILREHRGLRVDYHYCLYHRQF